MGSDTAVEGEGASFGGSGENELGVGEALLKYMIGGGRENGGEERGRKGGGAGASAVEENEGLVVGWTEGFDD